MAHACNLLYMGTSNGSYQLATQANFVQSKFVRIKFDTWAHNFKNNYWAISHHL